MQYREINMETYPRREHFAYFSKMENPYVGVTVNADISGLREYCKAHDYPFFLTLLHEVSAAANAVPELRRRILDGQIIEFDHCDTSHTVMHDDGTYSYCRLDCRAPLADYLPDAKASHEYAKTHATLDDGEDGISLLFISCLPWMSYTSFVQPTPRPADSNVRITWGKAFDQDGKTYLPVTLLAHHGLVDGIHMAKFYEELERRIAAL
ncbi:MAG: CatA-like O-acetyltransferase [Clostridia bacterium]|nr:CatA-like O-acetyltransferase [Clostridia bacterium]